MLMLEKVPYVEEFLLIVVKLIKKNYVSLNKKQKKIIERAGF
jgi:hypothetical protein